MAKVPLHLRKVKEIEQEMLAQRGYTIVSTQLNQIYDDTLYVHYCLEPQLSESLKIFVKKVSKLESGILIGDDETIKNLEKKTYRSYFDQLILKNIQLFTFEELSFNLTKSLYCPIYEKIDPSFIIPTIANANQLPRLLLNDPIVKFYNFKIGNVIRVTTILLIDVVNDTNISYCIVTK